MRTKLLFQAERRWALLRSLRLEPLSSGDSPNAPMSDNTEKLALIERILLVLLVIALFVAVAAIIKPFFTAILFGASLATAAWPVRQALIHGGLGLCTR